MLEQGKGYGLKQRDVIKVFEEKDISFTVVKENEKKSAICKNIGLIKKY